MNTALKTTVKPKLGTLVITLSVLMLAGCQSATGSKQVLTEDPLRCRQSTGTWSARAQRGWT